jgi:hypothetical protein
VGLPRDRLRLVVSLVGLGLPCGGVSAQLCRMVGLLLLLSFAHSWNTNSALCFLYLFCVFSLVSRYVSCKTCFSENKWNKVKVYAYVSKFVYFSCFWTIIGGSKYALVTANTYSGSFLERISRKARSEGTSVLAELERMVLHGASRLMRSPALAVRTPPRSIS